MLKIGIDFDNTIACYADAFYQAAIEKNLIPKDIEPSKAGVRDYLRLVNQEDEWTKLQGYIYGTRMDLATPFEGVDSFFSHCQEKQIVPYIISHKTKHPYLGPQYDLHEAAKGWLDKQAFSPKEAFFELTLEDKLQRIGSLKCDYFIDDLPELLSEATFPAHVKKILFDPSGHFSNRPGIRRVSSWYEICDLIGVSYGR